MCHWHHCNESINPIVGLQICPVLGLRQLGKILLRFLLRLPSLLQAGLYLVMCTFETPSFLSAWGFSVSNSLWFALNFCWQKSSPFFLSNTLSYYAHWNLHVTFKHVDRKKDLVEDRDNYKRACLIQNSFTLILFLEKIETFSVWLSFWSSSYNFFACFAFFLYLVTF